MSASHADCALFDGRGDAASLIATFSEPVGDLCVVTFGGAGEGAGMSAVDADLHHRVGNLPASGTMTLAFVDGALSGRDLALALRCALVAVGPGASLSSGFGEPGSAGVYAAAAARVGARSCEALLFDGKSVGADKAVAEGLASFAAADVDAAIAQARARLLTMLCVAKANLLTWPFSADAARALVDR